MKPVKAPEGLPHYSEESVHSVLCVGNVEECKHRTLIKESSDEIMQCGHFFLKSLCIIKSQQKSACSDYSCTQYKLEVIQHPFTQPKKVLIH